VTGTALVVWRKHYIRPRKPPKPFRTICEVLRELYRDAEARQDALSLTRITEAYDMAKRMQRASEQYKPDAPYIVSNGYAPRRG
jgi:hypothetical protein